MLELGRERHNSEQLQKNLNAQNQAHKELIESMNNMGPNLIKELTKEGSLLTDILDLENSIQTK